MKSLCTICARGGSKGVKNKNLTEISGRPLLYYTINQAKEAGIFENIAVSSDSDEILETARKFGADLVIKRSDKLASDNAAKLPAIQDAGKQAEEMTGNRYDIFVDLDATSPLRVPDDIINAVNMLKDKNASNIITGMISRRSPYFNLVEANDKGIVNLSKPLNKPIVRRQDVPETYDMNASIYVWNRETFFHSKSLFLDKTFLYVMPEERSIDIDSPFDLEIVKFLLEKRYGTVR